MMLFSYLIEFKTIFFFSFCWIQSNRYLDIFLCDWLIWQNKQILKIENVKKLSITIRRGLICLLENIYKKKKLTNKYKQTNVNIFGFCN